MKGVMVKGVRCLLVIAGWLACTVVVAVERDVLAYVGGEGQQQLRTVCALSDGSVLIGGGTESMQWLPQDAPVTSLKGTGFAGPSRGKTAFLLHVSADLQRLLRVVTLPLGSAVDVCAIRTTNIPGAKTGALFISGLRLGDKQIKPGYYIAQLDGNFVDRPPTKLRWVHNVDAGDTIAEDQPRDIGAGGKVVFAEGTPHGYDWVAIKRLTSPGKLDVVEDWRLHWYQDGEKKREWSGSPASQYFGGKVVESAIVLKVWGRGDFRSWTRADYEAKLPDGNGGVKQGRGPLDAFFEGPFYPADPNKSPRGRGYTGYGWPSTPCGNVGAIAIDRRNNHLYIGGNNKSTLPSNPDFEPYVIAMTSSGKLKWWMRLYPEVPPKQGESKLENVDARLSTPDQYIDGIAIDYAKSSAGSGALVVLARCHGNNVVNFWNGNKIRHASNPGTSFQPHFTVRSGNIHYGWLGRLTLDTGEMLHATFIAEYAEGAKVGVKSWNDENLDGWPRFDAAWPDVNTTRCRSQVNVDQLGNIYVCGTGRRPITTKNALMKMPKPGEGVSRWCDFVRVYSRDLTTLRYSSIIAGTWDWKTGEAGSGVSLQAATPIADGLLLVGYSTLDSKTGTIGPTPMPVQNRPSWSTSTRHAEDGIVGRLEFHQAP